MAECRLIFGPGVDRLRDRQSAMADVEIDRRIKLRIVKFFDHVRADDANLRRTMRHEGRNIECTHADDPCIRPIGRELECAALFVVKFRIGLDADPCASSGSASSSMRPLGTAMMSGAVMIARA
jgi:hypothetical protein